MMKVNIKIDTDLTVGIGECRIEVEISMDRIIEEGHNIITIIEVMLCKVVVHLNVLLNVV